ncbi:MAG: TIGR04076 family protein [Clostridia bacterium]|nr:TIGR04076 family protein [Clostridia bacterium]
MKKVKITVMRRSEYPDLMAQYENPIDHTCDMILGQTFVSVNGTKPDGLCNAAWECMYQFVKVLAQGGGNFYDGWMKNEKSAMISCNDGFRPVSFLLETMKDDAE